MDINDEILREISELSEQDQVAFLSTLSKKDQDAFASSLDTAIANQTKRQNESGFDSLLSGMQGGQPIPSPGLDITSDESQDLAKGILQTGAAVGAGIAAGPLGAAAAEGLGAGLIGTAAGEGIAGGLAGEIAGNAIVGEGTDLGEAALATTLGGGVGAAGGALSKGVSKALANETVREGINKVVSTAGNVLKSVGKNVDDAAERIFSGIVSSRETALNGLNKRRSNLLKKFSASKANPADVEDIANAVTRIESTLGAEQRGLSDIKNLLNKSNITEADVIRMSESADKIAFESKGLLPDEVKKSNLNNIIGAKVPKDYKSLNKAYETTFSEFGDSLDPNLKSFVSLLKQKADGKAIPTEVLSDAVTSTVSSKQAGAKLVGKLADDNIVNIDDIETLVLGKASQSAKEIPDIISSGDPNIVRDITSGPFNAGDELDALAQSGNFVQQSSTVDPNNFIPDPTKVFDKFKDEKFTKNFKNLLGTKGADKFKAISTAAKDVNKSKVLADEIRKFSGAAQEAGENASIADSVLQGFGEAQNAAVLNSKLARRQLLANPGTASLINQATQFGLDSLGPGR